MALPDYLKQYDKTPKEILGDRVLPPPKPPGVATIYRKQIGAGRGHSLQAKYRTPEALQQAVDLYFDRCLEEGVKPILSELAVALGFPSVDGFKKQSQRNEEFEYVVDQAYTRVEIGLERALYEKGTNTAGLSLGLKNRHGWKEKIEQTTTVEAGDSLTRLVQQLQGTVLRPKIPVQQNETIEEGEFEETDDEEENPFEEVNLGSGTQYKAFPNDAEIADIDDDFSDIC